MERKIVEIAPRTWLISDYLLAHMFLLEGDEKALLIDAGSGLGPLEEQVKSLTDKPLILALTHGHADHLGGCHLFPGVKSLIHPEDMFFAEEFTEAYAQEFIDNYVKTRGPVRNPEATDEDWKQIIRPYGPAEYGTLEDGEVFELGGRAVEVIHTPGHSMGSVCFLDHKERLLVTGDTVNDCLLLNFPPHTSTVAQYHESIQKLWAREGEYDGLCQGHDTLTIADKSFITDYLTATEIILSGQASPQEIDDGIHKGLGIRCGKVRLYYDLNSIR